MSAEQLFLALVNKVFDTSAGNLVEAYIQRYGNNDAAFNKLFELEKIINDTKAIMKYKRSLFPHESLPNE
jgi:hypothetical protein